MRILLLTDGITPFALGGMQKHSTILAQKLVGKGHEITLVHCGGKGYSPQAFKDLFPKNVDEVVVPFSDNSKLPGHYIRANKKYAKAIASKIKELEKFDLIYAQGFTGIGFSGSTIPLITNLHGFEMFQETSNLKSKMDAALLRKIALQTIQASDYIYSFGGKIDTLLRKLKISEKKILHQMNGISESWITDKPLKNRPCKKFVFIGRQERRKGIEELNLALQKFNLLDLAIEFHFIGPIDAKQQLDFNWVNYHGLVKDEATIKSILDEMDCLVCPSYSEGMPTVIAEAMARGCTVIATDVGAVSRQFNDNGALLESPTVNGIFDAIKDMAEMDIEKVTLMRQKSLEKAKKDFTWEEIVNQKVTDFEQILKSF